MKCQLKIESDNIMNIRSLYDRIVGKRIEEQETTRARHYHPRLCQRRIAGG